MRCFNSSILFCDWQRLLRLKRLCAMYSLAVGVLNNIPIQSNACSNLYQHLSELSLSFNHPATPPLHTYVCMYIHLMRLLSGLAGSAEEHREVLCNESAEEGCSDWGWWCGGDLGGEKDPGSRDWVSFHHTTALHLPDRGGRGWLKRGR